MRKSAARQVVQEALARADVHIGGTRSWDIRVAHPQFYDRVLVGGSLAWGESYMDGWWHCTALDQFFDRVLSARLDKNIKKNTVLLARALKEKLPPTYSRSKAFVVGKRHYDIGNRLFACMLDKGMNYSCAYW